MGIKSKRAHYRRFFSSLKEGQVCRLGKFGILLVCGKRKLQLPGLDCDFQDYARLTIELIAPMMAIFTDFTLQYIEAVDWCDHQLPLLTEHMTSFVKDSQYFEKELKILYELKFEVVKVS